MPAYTDWPADEQVVAPDQEAEHRDGHAGEGDEAVAEDRLAREDGDDLADHAHARQNHDVDGRVRVEPEEVLEEHRIAAQRRVEDADVEDALAATSSTMVMASTGVPSTWIRLVA